MLKSKTEPENSQAPEPHFFFYINVRAGLTYRTSELSPNSLIKIMNLINHSHQGYFLKTVHQICRQIGEETSKETSVISNTLFIAHGSKGAADSV